MRVETYTVGEFQENTYLIVDKASGTGVMVDPGGEGDRLVAAVEAAGVRLNAVWITHAHLDHIGGIARLRSRWNVPLYMHPEDGPLYEAGERQAQYYGLAFEPAALPDREFADGDRVSLGQLEFSVMHAPGHSPGHVVIHGNGVAFVGDCLFAGSVGRTDLPGSDGRALELSLERIAALPPETVVYPGHGPSTTIAEERATNPFLTGAARIPR